MSDKEVLPVIFSAPNLWIPSRRAVLLAVLVGAGSAPQASAADKHIYTAANMRAALANGGPVLVEIHAPWCPICRMQAQAVGVVINQPRFAAYTTFSVDFDTQKDVVMDLRVAVQSTLIVFRMGFEVARSVGAARRSQIEAILALGL